jgi:hypothetical protein
VARAERLPGSVLYDLARAVSLASAAARVDGKLPGAQKDRLARQYASRAVALLSRAWAAGLFRNAGPVADLKKDTDFDPLRDRADFRKLLAELEQKKTNASKK